MTEELASLKTENSDIVQDSVNLVTQKKIGKISASKLFISWSVREKPKCTVSQPQ